jgi:hypothetical protein
MMSMSLAFKAIYGHGLHEKWFGLSNDIRDDRLQFQHENLEFEVTGNLKLMNRVNVLKRWR